MELNDVLTTLEVVSDIKRNLKEVFDIIPKKTGKSL